MPEQAASGRRKAIRVNPGQVMSRHQTAAKKDLSQASGLNRRKAMQPGQTEDLCERAAKAAVTCPELPENPGKGHERREDAFADH